MTPSGIHATAPTLARKTRLGKPRMRYAIVTETYPPEVNGVALTVQGLEQGLRARGHDVTLVRPRQPGDDRRPARARTAGPRRAAAALSRPAPRAAGHAQAGRTHWTAHRPDAIYVATEGPLGWSALRAARRLGIPAATGFHTRFDQYMRDYGAGVPRAGRAALDAPLPQRRRRHAGADARAGRIPAVAAASPTWCGCRARSTRSCSIPARRDPGLRAHWGARRRWRGRDLRRPHRRGEEPRPGRARVPRSCRTMHRPDAALRLGRRRPGARAAAARQSRLHLLRHPARRSAGAALRQRRPVPVPQPQRNLRQRHAGGDGQRRADGRVRLRRRARTPARRRAWRGDRRRRRRRLHRRRRAHRRATTPQRAAMARAAREAVGGCARTRSPPTSTRCCRDWSGLASNARARASTGIARRRAGVPPQTTGRA